MVLERSILGLVVVGVCIDGDGCNGDCIDGDLGDGRLVTAIMENGGGDEVVVTWDRANPHLEATYPPQKLIITTFSFSSSDNQDKGRVQKKM